METKGSARDGSERTITGWRRRTAMLIFLIPLAIAGCDEPYYAGRPAYGPGYVSSGPAVSVEIGDRPYYTRGPGYYVGPSYYVWRPGHWRVRRGRRFWVHGHYAVR